MKARPGEKKLSFFFLRQVNSLEIGKGHEKGEEAAKEKSGGKDGAERPHFRREMITECQNQEHGNDADSTSMTVRISKFICEMIFRKIRNPKKKNERYRNSFKCV